MKSSMVETTNIGRIRPGSACFRETESVKVPSRFESPSRKSTAVRHSVHVPKRISGAHADTKAVTFQAINQNLGNMGSLGDINLLKERIDVLKKKYI